MPVGILLAAFAPLPSYEEPFLYQQEPAVVGNILGKPLTVPAAMAAGKREAVVGFLGATVPTLPASHVALVKGFVVEPGEGEGGALAATSADGRIHFFPGAEPTYWTLCHEVGHLVALHAFLRAEPGPDWQAAMEADGRAPSDYARQDAGELGRFQEDFAEAYAARLVAKAPALAGVRLRNRGVDPAGDPYKAFPARMRLLDRLLASLAERDRWAEANRGWLRIVTSQGFWGAGLGVVALGLWARGWRRRERVRRLDRLAGYEDGPP